MIDRKHFKPVGQPIYYRGYIIKIRKGSIFYLAEILDNNNNYIARTKFFESAEDAKYEALNYIYAKID